MASGRMLAPIGELGNDFITQYHLVAEFRALHASVLRLYEQSGGTDLVLSSLRRINRRSASYMG